MNAEDFCRGMEHVELWGAPVKWGTSNLQPTAKDCCDQCRYEFSCPNEDHVFLSASVPLRLLPVVAQEHVSGGCGGVRVQLVGILR